MRLISVTLQNYRIHRELTVNFDPMLTVIGGPNESGKSTLVEAIHRAFFMRYKTGGEDREQLVSLLGGIPSVSVEFEVGGRRCTVKKQFKGSSGSMVLDEEGRESLTQDKAESRLAELLGEEEIGRRFDDSRWAHLWTWQTRSFNDPLNNAAPYAHNILEEFQRSGGAIVQQSALDALLADRFTSLCQSIFRSNNSAKTGTELARAEELVEEANGRVAERTEILRKLRNAATSLTNARKTLTESVASLSVQEAELAAVRARKAQLTELRSALALQEKDVASTHAALGNLESREARIVMLREEIGRQKSQLAPMQIELERLVERERAAYEAAEASQRRCNDAELVAKRAAARAALAEAIVSRFDLVALLGTLNYRADTVERVRNEIVSIQARLAALPPVDVELREQLVHAEQRARLAEVALAARATRIELLAGADVVGLDGDSLKVGEGRVVTAAATLSIGTTTRLKITPGEGNDLTAVQRELDDARASLKVMLLDAGVDSVEQAGKIAAERLQLASQVESLEAELRGLNATTLADEREQLNRKINDNNGIIGWRQQQLTDVLEPSDGTEARALCDDLRAAQQLADEQTALLGERRAADDASAASARVARVDFESSLAEQRAALLQYETEEAGLVASEGSDAVRATKRADARAAQERASGIATATQERIAALEPDLIDTQEAQYQQGVERIRERREKARSEELVAFEQLRQDGSRDPHSELEVAVAEAERAREQLERAHTKASAIQLLAKLYEREREELSNQFTKPLCERVERYLRCVFPLASVSLSMSSGVFDGLALQRGRSPGVLPFDELSVGAREQVATALRLGIADVLAAQHDGTLPIIFDDAFAYSDADRLRRVRSMLFLASQRGLQVIVLSCTPAEYEGLGERVTLTEPDELPGQPVDTAPARTVDVEMDGREVADDETEIEAEEAEPVVVTEADLTLFQQTLASVNGSAGNIALRSQLGWDADRYDAVRMHLRERGIVKFGQGRGGTVKLVRDE